MPGRVAIFELQWRDARISSHNYCPVQSNRSSQGWSDSGSFAGLLSGCRANRRTRHQKPPTIAGESLTVPHKMHGRRAGVFRDEPDNLTGVNNDSVTRLLAGVYGLKTQLLGKPKQQRYFPVPTHEWLRK